MPTKWYDRAMEYRFRFIWYLVLIALTLIVAYLLGVVSLDRYRIEYPQTEAQATNTIGKCFIRGQNIPYYPETIVYGSFADKEIVIRIIQCESGGNPNAKNPNSTARGLMQVIKSSEEFCERELGMELDMYDPDDNLLCGECLMANGGLAHWEESRYCWNQ